MTKTATPAQHSHHSEARIQQDCCNWYKNTFCRIGSPHFNELSLIAHVKNEHRYGNDDTVHKGFADLILFHNGCRTPVFIEMKQPGKEQSPDQRKFERWAILMNLPYFVCRSLPEFKQIVLK